MKRIALAALLILSGCQTAQVTTACQDAALIAGARLP